MSGAVHGVFSRPLDRLGLRNLGEGHPLLPLVLLALLNAADELDQAAFNVLAPEIRDAFDLSNTGIVAVRALLIPLLPLFGLLIGFLADRRRRTGMAVTGALVWAGFSVATGLAPVLAVLFVARAGAGFGRQVNQPTHQGLLADYYPPKARAGVYSLWRLANPVGQLVGPISAGLLAAAFGWRAPFVILAVPTVALALYAARHLREPVRGGHERRAQGADDQLAAIEDEPPSWEEAWRTLNGVRTLRRVWRALPFVLGGILGFTILLPLFYDEVFGLDEAGRGFLLAFNEPFQIAGLLLGIPIATRMLATKPSSVLSFFALCAAAAAGGYVAVALAPSVVIAAVGSAVVSFSISVLLPGFAALSSLIVPPKVRSFGFSVNELWALPGLVFVLAAARIGDAYGLRSGLLAMVPVFLVGAAILASAGGQVAADIRTAQLGALAQAEARRAREKGAAKLLVCRGVDVHFGAVQVLFGVDFSVGEGEVVALLGTNGAGKSTLLRTIAGSVPPSGGAVVLDGRDVTSMPAQRRLGRGVVLMPGGRSVFPTLTVAENLQAAGWRVPDTHDLAARVEEAYGRFPQLRERSDQPAGNLSGGEQQMLGLSMALVSRPRLLLVDELSLGLAPAIVEQLLATVRELNSQGTTIVLVEQSVNVALTVAHRAVFMEKGEVRFEGPTAELLDRPDVLRSVFLEGAAPRATATPSDGGSVVAGEPLLEVAGLECLFGGVRALAGAHLQVAPGEIVGLIGPNGAGKTTLLDAVSGHVPLRGGTLRLAGRDITGLAPHDRARAGLGRSFQDARLFPSLTVRETIALAHDSKLRLREPFAAAVALPDQRVEEFLLSERVDELIQLLGLAPFADKVIGEVSTGSRRIVDLACALAHEPTVLLLDEPSSGIAQREAEALGPILRSVRDTTGMALVVVEHDMPLLLSVADRFVAMDLGRVIAEGDPRSVIDHPDVVAAYLGTDERVVARSGALKGVSE